MPTNKSDTKLWDEYCFRDIEIIAKQVTNLLDFLTEYDLGAFGMSAPSIAMSAFKHRFMSHEIMIHDRDSVLTLERESYYGGLVNNFYIGKSTGQRVHYVDVNSLYPAMMLKNYPTKLVGVDKFPSVIEVSKRLSTLTGCARVKINCETHTYPKRYDNRLCDVRGKYETWLCGEELKQAVNLRHATSIPEIAYYETKPIFADFVQYLWTMRKEAKKNGDNITDQLMKLLMNSLYGKFGMKGYQWYDFNSRTLAQYYELCGAVCPKEYLANNWQPIIDHDQCECNLDGLDRPIKLRYVAGTLQIKFPTGEHTDSFCAIAGHVTSYARSHLRKLIAIAGPKQVIYCDTDSLFVFDKGYQQLKRAGELDNHELGKLKTEGVSTNWQFRNAKDYDFAGVAKLKGVRKNATKISKDVYEQVQFEGITSIMKRGAEPFIKIIKIRKTISHKYLKGIVGKDGWVTPFTLRD